MNTHFYIAQIYGERSQNSLQNASFYNRSNKEIIRFSRWADGHASSGGATSGAGQPFHLPVCPFPVSGLYPSNAEGLSFPKIQPGWRQVLVECVKCGARDVLDRSSAAHLWQQISELLKSIHKTGCEYANSFIRSASSIVSEQGKTNILFILSNQKIH